MSERKSKQKTYDLIGARASPQPVSPVDKVLQTEVADLANEYERTRLEELVERNKKRLESMRRKGGGDESQPSQTLPLAAVVGPLIYNPEVQKEWLELGAEQRNTIIQSINALQVGSPMTGAGAGAGIGAYAAFLPLMIANMRGNPNTDVKTLVDLIKAIAPQQPQPAFTLEGVAALIKATREEKSDRGITELFETFIKPMYANVAALSETVGKQRIDTLEKEITALKGRPGLLEDVQTKAKEIFQSSFYESSR